MLSENDKELAWLKGDQQAFGLLYARYQPLLFGIARSYLDDSAEAGDVVQDVFLKLWNQRKTLIVSTVKAYLFQMVKNRCLDIFKGKRANGVLEDADEVQASEKSGDRIEAQQTGAQLKDLIKALSPQCRTVFLLVRFESMKYKEVAELLNISPKTVENHMGRALKALRLGMEEHGNGGHGMWLFALFAADFLQQHYLFHDALGVRAL